MGRFCQANDHRIPWYIQSHIYLHFLVWMDSTSVAYVVLHQIHSIAFVHIAVCTSNFPDVCTYAHTVSSNVLLLLPIFIVNDTHLACMSGLHH
jgi:hypothetical protein